MKHPYIHLDPIGSQAPWFAAMYDLGIGYAGQSNLDDAWAHWIDADHTPFVFLSPGLKYMDGARIEERVHRDRPRIRVNSIDHFVSCILRLRIAALTPHV